MLSVGMLFLCVTTASNESVVDWLNEMTRRVVELDLDIN